MSSINNLGEPLIFGNRQQATIMMMMRTVTKLHPANITVQLYQQFLLVVSHDITANGCSNGSETERCQPYAIEIDTCCCCRQYSSGGGGRQLTGSPTSYDSAELQMRSAAIRAALCWTCWTVEKRCRDRPDELVARQHRC